MGVKQRIKTIVPHRVWRVLQGCKANMTLASYYAGQRKRFLRFCAGQWNVGQSEQLRGTMVYYIHRIEKGLSHRRFRAGFGRSAFGELRSVMDEWRERDYPVDDVTYIAARQVVRAYVRKHRALEKPIPEFVGVWFADEVASVDIESVEQAEKADVAGNAGVKTVRAADKRDNASLDYAALFAGRSSVREYAETPVDMGTVRKAVSMSMKTPSVCNRQAYRVLLISNPKFIEQALALQGGWRGYDAPPVLALISVDVRGFVSVVERNEPYIDGGLFAMAFLTALECESLAACPLNTMMREKQEHEIRKLLGVPDYETLIAFVAIGNFPESIESPVSFRYDASVITRELN